MSSASEASAPNTRRVLVVLTRSPDPLDDVVTTIENTLPDVKVDTFDLTTTAPDYSKLLAAIFSADSVQVW